MESVAINLDESPAHSRRATAIERSVSSVDFVDSLQVCVLTFQLFSGSLLTVYSQSPGLNLVESFLVVLRDRSARPVVLLSSFLLAFALVELVYSKWANSLALVASAFFDLTDAAVLLVGVWGKTLSKDRRPTLIYSYGFERYEVILKFGAASYFAFVCLWIFFEGVERILEVEPTFIHGSMMSQVGLVGVVLQVIHTTVFRKYSLMARNSLTAQSTLLALGWEFIADVAILFCGVLISYRGLFLFDTFLALFLTTLIAYQMIPIMRDTAMILMLATPKEIPTAKILREVSTLEGVLEVRKEHFWSVGERCFVATLRVRIRNEMNEEIVQNKIRNVCEPFVTHLTIQIEKDNWDTMSSSSADKKE